MYATLERANAYMQEYYASTDPIRTSWEALTDEDKQVLLNRAELMIDQLPLRGKATNPPKAFPRKPNEEYSLQLAQIATIELAAQYQDEVMRGRLSLKAQGVKSYKIGDLSETFGSGYEYSGVDKFTYDIVFPFLKDWLGGGYRICPTQTHQCCGRRARSKDKV